MTALPPDPLQADPLAAFVESARRGEKTPLAWVVAWSRDGADPLNAAWQASRSPAALAEFVWYLGRSAQLCAALRAAAQAAEQPPHACTGSFRATRRLWRAASVFESIGRSEALTLREVEAYVLPDALGELSDLARSLHEDWPHLVELTCATLREQLGPPPDLATAWQQRAEHLREFERTLAAAARARLPRWSEQPTPSGDPVEALIAALEAPALPPAARATDPTFAFHQSAEPAAMLWLLVRYGAASTARRLIEELTADRAAWYAVVPDSVESYRELSALMDALASLAPKLFWHSALARVTVAREELRAAFASPVVAPGTPLRAAILARLRAGSIVLPTIDELFARAP